MDTPDAGTPRARGLPQRPPPPEEALNADGSVDVQVRAHVMQLTSIDSREQVFKAALWLQVRAGAARGRLARLGLRSDRRWGPDTRGPYCSCAGRCACLLRS